MAQAPAAPSTVAADLILKNGNIITVDSAGARVRAGYWFDPWRSRGIEVDAFVLDRSSSGFALHSDGSPILAHPFIDADNGLPSAFLVAFSGSLTGSIAIEDTSRLFGAGAA